MRLWFITLTLAGGLLLSGTGCDKLGIGGAKKEVSKDDDDDSDSKKKKHKHKKKSSDDDDDDDTDSKKEAQKTATPSSTTPVAPSTGTPVAAGEKFAGLYRSTFGDVSVRQTGNQVDCTYPAGTVSCTATGVDLDCTWKEGGSTGKAKLKKQGNGDLDGTWGNGSSATSGGRWLFTLLSAGDPGPSGNEAAAGSFAGVYVSTWGDTVFTQDTSSVKGKYPGGVLDCVPSGAVLECGWREGGSTGKAHLTRQANGDISGTWGNGASASNGGSWLFRKK